MRHPPVTARTRRFTPPLPLVAAVIIGQQQQLLQLLLVVLLLLSTPVGVQAFSCPSDRTSSRRLGLHHLLASRHTTTRLAMVSAASSTAGEAKPPPIAWTIAGSDSGGGAGIQADLLAFHALGCHGCSAITALTAQNSHEVRAVQTSSLPQLRATLEALRDDLPPRVVKLGMLATAEVVEEVASFLEANAGALGPIICDPVMVTTSGSILLDENARSIIVNRIFSRAALVTPNKHEAEVLVGYKLARPEDIERAARDLLALGKSRAVLVKGGHALGEEAEQGEEGEGTVAQDYLLDGESGQGMWISSPRLDNPNTHGTGCTLSSATAAFLARGLGLRDAVVMAKAYVSQGIQGAMQLGLKGPGPVRQTGWPSSPQDFPWVTSSAATGFGAGRPGPFPPCERRIGLYACVDSSDWVRRLFALGVKDVQLRIKDRPMAEIEAEVAVAADAARAMGGRLWVNDYWALAVKHGAYGLHVGQEDLDTLWQSQEGGATSPLDAVREAGVRLGISTHSFEELGRAVALRPSYISLGPIYPTASKQVRFGPQGPQRIAQWRALVEVDTPLVAIGGIGLETAPACVAAGADGVCVISAVTKAADVEKAVREWQALFPPE